MHWHIALTQPNQDDTAAKALRARCYLVYNPICYRRVRILGRRYSNKLRPMFPGYLFVDAGPQSWERLRTAPGIWAGEPLLRARNGEYAVLPEEVYWEIRRTELAKMAPLDLPSPFTVGEELRVTEGMWSGFFGNVDRLDNEGASRLLLDVFNQKTPVWIPNEYLAPAENGGLCASR